MSGRILFLDENRMGMLRGEKSVMLTSRREQTYRETLRELEQKHEWKSSGAGAQFMKQHNPYGGRSERADCHIPALAAMDGKILYALRTPDVSGLYLKDADDDAALEGHRFGERGFFITDIDACGDCIACAVYDVQSEYHIALLEEGRAGYRWLTQGDTQDSAPWLSRREDALYYSSAGLARDEEGRVIAKGPGSVQKLSLASGTLEEICAAPDKDFLRPKEGPDGALYVIVRPYKLPEPPRRSLSDRVKDTRNFFRALGTIVRVIGKTEAPKDARTAAGGGTAAQMRTLNDRQVTLEAPKEGEEEQGWAPQDWTLMRCESGGGFTEIQRGVADYVFDGDRLIYTDGRRIFACENGQRRLLYKGAFISRVAILPE